MSDATTLKLGDHLASQSESECDFCAVMPANAGCCVGCGCSLAEQGHDETTMIEAPKMVESDESQEEIPAFLADAAKAMVDSQATWVATHMRRILQCVVHLCVEARATRRVVPRLRPLLGCFESMR